MSLTVPFCFQYDCVLLCKERCKSLYQDCDVAQLSILFLFLFKAVKVSWDMLLKEGRQNAKKVLVVISDKGSSSSDSEIRKEVKPLQDNDATVIPVALGNEADERQLKLLTDGESGLVTAKITDDTTDIKNKLMVVVFKG